MNTTLVIIAGIAFLIVGIALCAVSYIFKQPKSASKLFFIVGAITAVMGLMALVLHNEITKLVIQLAGLIYLVLLIIAMSIFTAMTKGITQDETDHTQR